MINFSFGVITSQSMTSRYDFTDEVSLSIMRFMSWLVTAVPAFLQK